MAATLPSATEPPSRLESIPTLGRKPVVGNLFDVDARRQIHDLMDIGRRLGPIFRLDMLGRPLTVVWGFDLVDELCDERRFDKSVRGALQRIRKDGGGGDGLFTAYTSEKNWSRAHTILLPNFSDRAMAAYHGSMLDVASQMMLKWERMNPDDEIDVSRDMTALTLDTIGLCGFGYRFNSFYRDDNHPFVEAMLQMLEGSMNLRGVPFEDVGGRKLKRLHANTAYIAEVADGIIAERRRGHALEPDREKRDLLDYMIDGIDKKSGEGLDDVNIRRQLQTFLVAGHETTSGLLSFCIYYLLNHPDVARKATEEVDRVFGSDTAVLPTVRQVNSLQYVQMVLKETLRLWPTAPAFGVYPMENEVVGGKYLLKKNSHVLVLLPLLHRDKTVWGDRAELFDPDEHFSPEAEARRPANAFKAFGNGQRACIGSQFAMQEATLVIGMVLQRFELVDHRGYEMRVRESLTIKPENLKIRVRRRPDRASRIALPERTSGGPVRDRETQATREAAALGNSAAGPHDGTPLLVLYGSNLGSSEDFAREIAEVATAQSFSVTIGALDDFVRKLPTAGAVAIVTASYNGAPPDNAAAFYEWLRETGSPQELAGVCYTVFGAGNRNWASTYQSVPRAIDERLAARGAKRIHVRGEGDAKDDLSASFDEWKSLLWPSMSAALGLDLSSSDAVDRPMYEMEVVPLPQVNPIAESLGARGLRVLQNRELQTGGERSTRHIEVAMAPGTTYAAGDHLGVLPSNGAALVERVLNRFGFDAASYVRLHSTGVNRIASLPLEASLSVKRLFTHYVELQTSATRKQIAALAAHTRCPVSKPALNTLSEDVDAYREQIRDKRVTVLDLLERFPACELPPEAYLAMLQPMVPRYYSISSSPRVDATVASITVRVVREAARNGSGIFEGVASTYLARREPGSRLLAFVKSSKSGFALPVDPAVPIVMIGPGTGVAPFRGFLAERAEMMAAGARLGPAMLFFGCRHERDDFSYRDEFEAHVASGTLDLNVAFSRDGDKKMYVQDLLVQRSERVWELIEAGAVIYVCGDASRMEPDVRRRLLDLFRAKRGTDEVAATSWLAELSAQRRYVLDVWASD